jgi:ribosomal protein L37AE/L43A
MEQRAESMKECPRCGASHIQKLADSPVVGVFTIWGCRECNYVWRSTESLAAIKKLTEEAMEKAVELKYQSEV